MFLLSLAALSYQRLGFGVLTLPSWLQGLALEEVQGQRRRLGTDTVKCLSLSLGWDEWG